MFIQALNQYNNRSFYYKNNNKITKPINRNINFEAKVDKGLARFYEVNASRLPLTLQNHIATINDFSSVSPIQAQKEAFIKLEKATSVQQIKKELFPDEPLFSELKSIQDTDAKTGILGAFREMKEILDKGILKDGSDFTIYLLRKIFLEAKLIDEINEDLDRDLDKDFKIYFRHKNNKSDYILPSTLKALGIQLPKVGYINSLKFTREGYSDDFAAKVSAGQKAYWNGLSEKERTEILVARLSGRDNWWNSMTHEERLDMVAGAKSADECYKEYKKFKREEKLNQQTEEEVSIPQSVQSKKRIAVGSKLKDRDIFTLWMKKNLEKYYNSLSQADKDSVHIKRVRIQTLRWQEMTPEERTEHINKLKSKLEPLKYTMIDAWNNSTEIIAELSKFLKSKQILKPIGMLYKDEPFSEFQSAIMTEFWAAHPDFAEKLGENIKKSQEKVENAIKNGVFDDLKHEINRDREYRIYLMQREESAEIVRQQRAAGTEKREQSSLPLGYKEDFVQTYKAQQAKKGLLPGTYINDITEALLEMYPEDTIKEYTRLIKNGSSIEMKMFVDSTDTDISKYPKFARATQALSTAIANVMSEKHNNPSFFERSPELTIPLYLAKFKETLHLNSKDKAEVKKIEALYNEYRKDLTDLELTDIAYHYFLGHGSTDPTHDEMQDLKDYISTYGRSALILYDTNSLFSKEQRKAFNNKFIKMFPEEVSKKHAYLLAKPEDIEYEEYIRRICNKYAKTLNYLPQSFVERYVREWAYMFRWSRAALNSGTLDEKLQKIAQYYTAETFEKHMLEKEQYIGQKLIITPPSTMMFYPVKIEMFAAEKALADELYEITGDKNIYGMSFESLTELFRQVINAKSFNNLKIELNDGDFNGVSLIVNKRPNLMRLKNNFRDYIERLNDTQKEYSPEYELSNQDLVYALNDDPELDEMISKKFKEHYRID